MRRSTLALIFCTGCNLLFPEFDHPVATDAASADADASPHIAGTLCTLGDLRDYRSCGPNASTTMRVTVEETRDAATVDNMGRFMLPLSEMLTSAILAAADSTSNFTPTVTTVALPGGSVDGLAVPVLQANILEQVALANGVALDSKKGVIFGWATDGKGVPVAGFAASAPAGANGPFYDGPQASEVITGNATSSHGLIAFFNVTPGVAQFVVGNTTFKMPVRAGALTMSILVTAP